MKNFVIVLLVLILAVLNIGCPSVQTDPTSSSQIRTFTVPFDKSGFIYQYDFRYTDDSTKAWVDWELRLGTLTPGVIGTMDSVFMNLPEGTWFVAMMSSDSYENWSGISNIVHVVIDNTPPETVNDLK